MEPLRKLRLAVATAISSERMARVSATDLGLSAPCAAVAASRARTSIPANSFMRLSSWRTVAESPGAEYTARRTDGAPIDFLRIDFRKKHWLFTRCGRWRLGVRIRHHGFRLFEHDHPGRRRRTVRTGAEEHCRGPQASRLELRRRRARALPHDQRLGLRTLLARYGKSVW